MECVAGLVILQVAFTAVLPFRVRKILNLRVFEDEGGKHWSKSVMDKQYEVLCVSQFTLQCVLKGNKPDFHLAMPTEQAESFYNSFLEQLRKTYRPELIKGRQQSEPAQEESLRDISRQRGKRTCNYISFPECSLFMLLTENNIIAATTAVAVHVLRCPDKCYPSSFFCSHLKCSATHLFRSVFDTVVFYFGCLPCWTEKYNASHKCEPHVILNF